MLVLSTKPFQKLTGTDRDGKEHVLSQADALFVSYTYTQGRVLSCSATKNYHGEWRRGDGHKLSLKLRDDPLTCQ